MNVTTSHKSVSTVPQDAFATKIVLVDRGDCSFVTKVRNAERAGASLVVVVDDRAENITNVIMGDDGTGMGLRIPAMLIGSKSGATLKNYAITSDKVATLSAEFVMKSPDNVVEMEFWYSSNNVLALDFLKEFDKYMYDLQDYLAFVPRFVTWGCEMCTEGFKQVECFGDGKYCAPNHSMFDNVQGKEVILEDLRETCLHSKLASEWRESVWWDYMRYVHMSCYDFVSEDCSKRAHEQIGEDFEKTMRCVESSFDGQKMDYHSDNEILAKNSEAWRDYGILYWPSVTINKVSYRGDITPANILEAVCAGLYTKPRVCLDFYEEEDIAVPVNSESIVTAELLVFVVVLLLAVNVVLIVAYRRCAKKEGA